MAVNIGSDFLTMQPGIELVDPMDVIVRDISNDLVAAKVKHSNFGTIHTTAQIRTATELNWGYNKIRLYVIISDGVESQRWNMGVFYMGTPEYTAGTAPQTFEVDCYDKLTAVRQLVGKTYQLAAGSNYITSIKQIITTFTGNSTGVIYTDPEEINTVAARNRTWPLDEGTSWLKVANDMLDSINYAGMWIDRDGAFQLRKYLRPMFRSPMWTYNAQSKGTTLVGFNRGLEREYFDSPNHWIFYIADAEGNLPAPGAGYYEVWNQSDGPLSFDARGRWITRVTTVEGAQTHADLVRHGDNIVDNDKMLDTAIKIVVAPNPNHWHLDTILYTDADLGFDNTLFAITNWELDLFTGDMSIEAKQVQRLS